MRRRYHVDGALHATSFGRRLLTRGLLARLDPDLDESDERGHAVQYQCGRDALIGKSVAVINYKPSEQGHGVEIFWQCSIVGSRRNEAASHIEAGKPVEAADGGQ